MNSVLLTIQIVTAVLLVIVILVQNRGEGLSGAFGGTGGEFYATRRGAEKMLFKATVILAVIFGLNALVYAFLPKLQILFA